MTSKEEFFHKYCYKCKKRLICKLIDSLPDDPKTCDEFWDMLEPSQLEESLEKLKQHINQLEGDLKKAKHQSKQRE